MEAFDCHAHTSILHVRDTWLLPPNDEVDFFRPKHLPRSPTVRPRTRSSQASLLPVVLHSHRTRSVSTRHSMSLPRNLLLRPLLRTVRVLPALVDLLVGSLRLHRSVGGFPSFSGPPGGFPGYAGFPPGPGFTGSPGIFSGFAFSAGSPGFAGPPGEFPGFTGFPTGAPGFTSDPGSAPSSSTDSRAGMPGFSGSPAVFPGTPGSTNSRFPGRRIDGSPRTFTPGSARGHTWYLFWLRFPCLLARMISSIRSLGKSCRPFL
jgi:hypothetical protein